jgi:hypothetical protein
VTITTPFTAFWQRSPKGNTVPRQALTFVRVPMPALGRRQLVDAVRLQLTQYLPAGPFGFVCKTQGGGMLVAWAWVIDQAAGSPARGRGWAESALDEPAQGLRLVRRSSGFEAQQWTGGELLHSRWFATLPGQADWQGFARGCGVDPQTQPLPEPTVAPALTHPGRGWLAGDNLPAVDSWQGWRWQVGLLLLGAVAAAALGVHLQTRQQLQTDSQLLQALRSGRESSIQARTRFDLASAELQALQALAPTLSQLELLDRVTASGIFSPPATTAGAAPAKPAPSLAPGMPAAAAPAQPAGPRLLDWDVRNGQLKMTLELPERDITLLDITRRLESVPGLGLLRVGQDGTSNALTLSARVVELAPPTGADTPRPAGSGR